MNHHGYGNYTTLAPLVSNHQSINSDYAITSDFRILGFESIT